MKLRSQAVVVICCCFHRVPAESPTVSGGSRYTCSRSSAIPYAHIYDETTMRGWGKGHAGGTYGLCPQTHATLMKSNLPGKRGVKRCVGTCLRWMSPTFCASLFDFYAICCSGCLHPTRMHQTLGKPFERKGLVKGIRQLFSTPSGSRCV